MPAEEEETAASELEREAWTSSVLQRLTGHADITVENGDESDVPVVAESTSETATEDARDSVERRVYAKESRIWRAVAGHKRDFRLPPMEFQCLSIIAAHGPVGIIQPNLLRLTGQDKRSLPRRTDTLAKKGYIIKESILAKKIKTSRLRLKKFGADTKPFDATHPCAYPPDPICHGTVPVHCDQWYEGLLRLLQSNGNIMATKDLELGLGIIEGDVRTQSRALTRCMRRLVSSGCVRLLKAKVERDSDRPGPEKYVRCVQLLREPTEYDRIVFTKFGGPARRLGNKSGRSKRSKDPKIPDHSESEEAEADGEEDVETDSENDEMDITSDRDAVDDATSLADYDVANDSGLTPAPIARPRRIKKAPSRFAGTIQGVDAIEETILESDDQETSPALMHQLATPSTSIDRYHQSMSLSAAPGNAAIRILRRASSDAPASSPAAKRPRIDNGSLIVIFKSRRLHELPAFATAEDSIQSDTQTEKPTVDRYDHSEFDFETWDSLHAPIAARSQRARASSAQPNLGGPSADGEQSLGGVSLEAQVPQKVHGRFSNMNKEKVVTFDKAYVKAHPNQVFHHRGHGRWAPGPKPAWLRPAKSSQTAAQALNSGSGVEDGGQSSPPLASQTEAASDVAAVTTTSFEMTSHGDTPGTQSNSDCLGEVDVEAPDKSAPARLLVKLPLTLGEEGGLSNSRSAVASIEAPSDLEQDPGRSASVDLGPLTELMPAHITSDTSYKAKTAVETGSTGPTALIHQERVEVIMSVLKDAGGAFPGNDEIWYPFVTAWQRLHREKPHQKTVRGALAVLVRQGHLKKFSFRFHVDGAEKESHLITKPTVDPKSDLIKKTQRAMIDAWPGPYLPDSVEVWSDLREQASQVARPSKNRHADGSADTESRIAKRPRIWPAFERDEVESHRKRDANGSADTESRAAKRPRISPARERDEFEPHRKRDADGSADTESRTAKRRRIWHAPERDEVDQPNAQIQNIEATPSTPRDVEDEQSLGKVGPKMHVINIAPIVENVTVKRTAAGEHAEDVEAQKIGFKDAAERDKAVQELSRQRYCVLRRAKIRDLRRLNGEEVESEDASPLPENAPKTRGFLESTKTGAKRGPKAPTRKAIRDARAQLMKPRQAFFKVSGTFGTGVQARPRAKAGEGRRAKRRILDHDSPAPSQADNEAAEGPEVTSDHESRPETPWPWIPPREDDMSIANAPLFSTFPVVPPTREDDTGVSSTLPRAAPSLRFNTNIAAYDPALLKAAGKGPPTSMVTPGPLPTLNPSDGSTKLPSTAWKEPYRYVPPKNRAKSHQPRPASADANDEPDAQNERQGTTKKAPRPRRVKFEVQIDRSRLFPAVALIKLLTGGEPEDATFWELVCKALSLKRVKKMKHKEWQDLCNQEKHRAQVVGLQKRIEEPFLEAYERGVLPTVDLENLDKTDLPALLDWTRTSLATTGAEDIAPNLPNSRAALAGKVELVQNLERTSEVDDTTASSHNPFTIPVPLDSTSEKTTVLDPDLDDSTMLAKSWIRAVAITNPSNYSDSEAAETLRPFVPVIHRVVDEMVKSSTLHRVKPNRTRPGRNYEIHKFVFSQFNRWPGGRQGPAYLAELAAARGNIMDHFAHHDELDFRVTRGGAESRVLTTMVGQGLLEMTNVLPARSDDINATGPRLSIWGYSGFKHDTRAVDKDIFNFSAVYEKASAFTAQHPLNHDVPVPFVGSSAVCPEPTSRLPFWVDVHGSLIRDLWDLVLTSILHCVVYKPGSTANTIGSMHENKLWAWEIEMVLQWMEEVGLAVRMGTGNVVDGIWKGGWTASQWWYCAFAK